MVGRLTVVLTLGAITLLAGGCGTVANTAVLPPEEGGKQVYGGVRVDWEAARHVVAEISGDYPRSPFLFVSGLLAVDLPLSAIGDTVTLPYTIPYALWLGPKGGKERPSTPGDQPGEPGKLSLAAPSGAIE